MIDTHSHLYDRAFDADRAECIARDRAAGIEAVVLPAIDSATHGALWALCRGYPGYCCPLMGLHPTSVNEIEDYGRELEIVAGLLAAPPMKIYGVGEIGLDLYWSRDHIDAQTEALRFQIGLALRYGLPVVVHTRDAWAEMHAVLELYRGRGLRGVMHAFSGTYEDYLQVKTCGDFLFGIGGVVTYRKNALAEVVPRMSPDDIVLESDAPYLTPVPHRGGRNESGMIRHTCARIAELTGVTVEEVDRRTTENAKRMFGM